MPLSRSLTWVSGMCVNVSNAARRTHDRTGGQVYFPASQDIAGHGSGGRTSRPANCEWAALLVATGPGPLLGKNGGGATATHGVLLPRVIPSAAPGFEEPAAIVEEFAIAKGIANLEFIEEIGGGLNFKRPKFTALVGSVVADEVAMLVVAHKDRLARFGFELLQHLCRKHGSELLVLNTEKVSPEQEMVRDLMAITDCFSSRLYGLRNYRRALKEALK